MKRFFVLICAMALTFGLINSAIASDITSSGASGKVPVTLKIEPSARSFRVTLPTSLPITVNSNGTVSSATNAVITNHSEGSVRVTNMTVVGTNGWSIIGYDNAGSTSSVKTVALQINGCKTTDTGTLIFDKAGFGTMKAGGSSDSTAELTYDAKFPRLPAGYSGEIAVVTITVGWAS